MESKTISFTANEALPSRSAISRETAFAEPLIVATRAFLAVTRSKVSTLLSLLKSPLIPLPEGFEGVVVTGSSEGVFDLPSTVPPPVFTDEALPDSDILKESSHISVRLLGASIYTVIPVAPVGTVNLVFSSFVHSPLFALDEAISIQS